MDALLILASIFKQSSSMGTSSTLSKGGTLKPKKESKKDKNGKYCVTLLLMFIPSLICSHNTVTCIRND